MKQKLLKAIVATLILAVALSCGPGNGSKPYKGNSYISITAPADETHTSNGASYYIELTFTVYEYKVVWDDASNSYKIDSEAPPLPAPNMQTTVCVELQERTLQSYELEPPRLYGDDAGEELIGLGCLEFVSDFYGQIYPAVYVPSYFDGILLVKGTTISSFDTTTLTIRFRSGTSCTDGQDNDGDKSVDAADPDCVTGFDYERSTQCSNNVDDDGDTLTDLADPGCIGPTDLSEKGTYKCDNDIDDDGDTFTDYPNDPQCTGPTDDDESL